MSNRDEGIARALLVGGGLVVGLAILAADPNCDRGCKSVAQHLAEHVLGDMLAKLLA